MERKRKGEEVYVYNDDRRSQKNLVIGTRPFIVSCAGKRVQFI
jgi:hypothetical protein